MPDDIVMFEEIKQELSTNTRVPVHATCSELWHVSPADSKAQMGQLTDWAGDTMKFISYESSDVRELSTGTGYLFHQALVVSDETERRAVLADEQTVIDSRPLTRPPGVGPTCSSCGERIPEEGFHQDGNAPEIGWEYWQCPACGQRMRA
jgi:hypothetical protein